MTRLGFTLIIGLCYGAALAADGPLPLQDAIDALNAQTAAGYFEQERLRTPVLAKDKRPAPVTMEEVVAAIRGWDRTKFRVDETTYGIYKEIAETKVLPAKARLYFGDEWRHTDKQSKYEDRLWIIGLDVMTGPNTGRSFQIRQEKLDRRIALVAAPGYSWLYEPSPIAFGTTFSNFILVVERGEGGALLATTGIPMTTGLQELHVVAFDEQGNRHVLARERRWGAATKGFAMFRFRLDPLELPAANVRFLGIEELNTEGLKLSSEAAIRRAKQKMIEVLPLPEIGQRFDFSLTVTNGTKIDSSKLLGKVILIDCWASWCGPCIQELPEVKKVFEKWRGAGLEVVGLSLDSDAMAALEAAKAHDIPWPIVVAPGGEGARELWTEASRIETIPRLLLIDQKGLLSADLSGAEKLEEAVSVLLGR